ncbi:ras modification protein erf4 [Aspergillus brasiliensis]|nr:ras modification protein erf4 [Aspergillus brasiliensis]
MSCSDHLLSLAAPLFDPHPPIKAARCDRFLSLGHRHHFTLLSPQRLSSPRPPRPLRHRSPPSGPLGRFPLRKRLLSRHKRTLHYPRPRLKKLLLIPREASAFGVIRSTHIPPHPPISSPQRLPPKHDFHIGERVPGYLPQFCARRRCDSQTPSITFPATPRSRRPTPSPNSLLVERSQGETESGRSSIAVPRGQRRSGAFDDQLVLREMSESGVSNGAPEVKNPRAPERAHLGLDFAVDGPGPLHDDRPRHIQSQSSLRSQSHIASIPSNTGAQNGGEADVAEELAWGPAHPCYPHINPHVPIGSEEYMTTRIIRIRRDWMIKGDLAPTFSNLYPEILDPLLPEQEFRKVIATVNDELIKAFDPFSLRNFIDSALSLLTGWIWEDIGAPGIKSHLKRVEAWLERWNKEVGAKDGVHIWSLRRTAYMSLDIQIPDPKVGIIRSEGIPSLPGTRPSSGV